MSERKESYGWRRLWIVAYTQHLAVCKPDRNHCCMEKSEKTADELYALIKEEVTGS